MTAAIAAASRIVSRDGARAAVLPDAEHLWHGLVHHHFGHSAFARGNVDLKGLYEFCVCFHVLREEDRMALRRLAARDGAGLAALDLWLAIGHDVLALPLEPAPAADARATWEAMQQRVGEAADGKRYPGYRETLRLGWSAGRIEETGARTWLGRAAARWRVVSRLLPKVRRD
jgi:hypothetical protein